MKKDQLALIDKGINLVFKVRRELRATRNEMRAERREIRSEQRHEKLYFGRSIEVINPQENK